MCAEKYICEVDAQLDTYGKSLQCMLKCKAALVLHFGRCNVRAAPLRF